MSKLRLTRREIRLYFPHLGKIDRIIYVPNDIYVFRTSTPTTRSPLETETIKLDRYRFPHPVRLSYISSECIIHMGYGEISKTLVMRTLVIRKNYD